MVNGRVRVGFRVGLGLGLGVGLVASLLLTAGCRFTIPRDRGPITGSRYTTYNITGRKLMGRAQHTAIKSCLFPVVALPARVAIFGNVFELHNLLLFLSWRTIIAASGAEIMLLC